MTYRTGTQERRVILLGLLGLALACPAFPADRESTPVGAGLPWVRFNSSQFTRPRDTGISERIDVDTGTTFNDYSQLWVGLIEILTD